jgi:predicted RNase H-like HicB family nuclease
MARQKFTIMLIPDEDGYMAIVPYYSNVTAWGETPADALENARLTLESVLESEAEDGGGPVPYNVHASDVVVGEVEVEVPESLMADLNEVTSRTKVSA